jgi:hypothetical protein
MTRGDAQLQTCGQPQHGCGAWAHGACGPAEHADCQQQRALSRTGRFFTGAPIGGFGGCFRGRRENDHFFE